MLKLPPIPDKEFFSIGEVSSITQTPAYVLRYWESEFRLLRPARRNSGQRKYIKKDIEFVFKIKDLLYENKFTIAGAKRFLISEKRKKAEPSSASASDGGPVQLHVDFTAQTPEHSDKVKAVISETKKELESILQMLK
jgi:DNA-binding transcriptional MerR regulator